ncbi:MAG TPA: hypothetical protein VN317_03875 [Candidatus Methanoperedens sp.]|nr:hypothetical protein [Candidatus Methanoperedens sp.]
MGRAVRSLLLAAAVACAGAVPAHAAAPNFSAWDEIERLRGRYECEDTSLQENPSGPGTETARTGSSVSVEFELERTPSGWRTVRSHAAGRHDFSRREESAWRRASSSSFAGFSGPLADGDIRFRLDSRAGVWDFSAGGALQEPYPVRESHRKEEWRGGSWVSEAWEDTKERRDYPHVSLRRPLSGERAGALEATWEKEDDEREPKRFDYTTGRKAARVTLRPVWADCEVVVKIEGVDSQGQPSSYEKWLPRGTRSGQAGARLKATARLQGRGGKPFRVEVGKFRFELRDTSREPGVCMNFPRLGGGGGKGASADPPPDPEFDLRFDPRLGGTDGRRQVQRLEPQLDADGRPFAEAWIECYDYGAWGELVVVAELLDGREITGHLEGEPSVAFVKIPKRSGLSLIADAWKQDRGVALPDGDDGEGDPEGDGRPGDGLTLFEEYRGFFENGGHLRGDPKKKELFIGNRIGADAAGGIELFTLATGLTVHARMLPEELGDDRVLNGNRGRGPRRTVQHGVVMETDPRIDGGLAFDPQGRPPGPPKTTEKLLVGPLTNPSKEDGGFFSRDRGLRPSDQIFLYDAVIAHELLHCVSVSHHGEDDQNRFFFFTIPGVEKEYPGGVFLGEKDPGTGKYRTSRVLAENGKDFADVLAEPYRGNPGLVQALAAADAVMAARVALVFYEGIPQGQHSGSDECLMRYMTAQIYASKKHPPDLFYLTQGERPGYGLCDTPAGTGVNGPRNPEPRYGAAKPGRGDCAHQICVSDVYDPVKR